MILKRWKQTKTKPEEFFLTEGVIFFFLIEGRKTVTTKKAQQKVRFFYLEKPTRVPFRLPLIN